MKKCILFILSFCFIFLISIKANANIIPEFTGNKAGLFFIEESREFNIIAGCPDDYMTNSPFYSYVDHLMWSMEIESGGYYWTGEIRAKGNSSIKASYYAEFKIGSSSEIYATVKLDGDVIYHMQTTGSDDPVSDINKEIDLNEYFSTEGLTFVLSNTGSITETSDFVANVSGAPDYNEMDFQLTCLVGTVYKNNTVYDGKDLYYVTSVVDPITVDEILSTIVITDPTEGDISQNARVAKGDYILVDGKIGLGTYYLLIAASDEEGNTTVQKVYITVADVTPPTINGTDTTRAYYDKLSDVKTLFTASDNSGDCSLEIIEDNYTDNFSSLGDYAIEAKATDGAGNTAYATATITVYDDIAPILAIKDVRASTTNPLLDEDDLHKYITCTDYIDGNNTIVEIEDTDSYFSNTGKVGLYNFKVIGKDQSGNETIGNLNLTIYDSDYPEITADTYTITVNVGESLSMDDIKNMLLEIGQINSLNDLVIQSNYFDTPNVAGSYDLIISTPTGVYKDVINVRDNSNTTNQTNIDTVDFSTPDIKDAKDFTYLYVIAGVALVLILSSVGFVIYKRKH